MATLELTSFTSHTRKIHRFRLLVTLLMLLCIAITALPLPSQATQLSDVEIKAFHVYSFKDFFRWKEDKNKKTSTICVFEREENLDSVGRSLIELIEKKNSPVKAKQNPPISDLEGCQIIYLDQSQEPILKDILVKAKNHSVMTISDIKSFVRRGGMIGLIPRDEKIRFEVNILNAERAGIVIDVNLLGLAEQVMR